MLGGECIGGSFLYRCSCLAICSGGQSAERIFRILGSVLCLD